MCTGGPFHEMEAEKESAAWLITLVRYIAREIERREPGELESEDWPDVENAQDWRIRTGITTEQFETRLNHIRNVCGLARRIFSHECRVVKVDAPCVIFGDIHGNLFDLLTYETNFWSTAPGSISGKFVFLGDYVDRGQQSLEVFLYLISMKCLFPDQIYMLRGNHETRSIQRDYSFKRECEQKFGAEWGPRVWETLNEVMDVMPLCGVIAGKIFCVHGGIPKSVSKISELENMPVVLPNPESQYPAAWEMLWNDPKDSSTSPFRRGMSPSRSGFTPNTDRNTAWFFNEYAVDNFLRENGLSNIVRAHEEKDEGFDIKFGGKVITVFSSSCYEWAGNMAAFVKVGEDGSMKITPLHTRAVLESATAMEARGRSRYRTPVRSRRRRSLTRYRRW